MVRLSLPAIALLFVSGTHADFGEPPEVGSVEMQADPRKGQPLDRWPNGADLARLASVEGKRKGDILRVLGHPSRVERRSDGEEVWDYDWSAACRVWVRNGVCVGTFYTGGY